jgi:hypothetical protein
MNTVFVIGAGANVEIGMPSGKELKNDIAEFLNFSSILTNNSSKNRNVYFAMQDIFHTTEKLSNIASKIREAMPVAISIDNFLDAHRLESEIAIAGKLAVIASIIAAERQSSLFSLHRVKYDLSNTWYPLFFQKITERCEINEFIERLKNISFIIFNYDRCFEYYMIYALESYYKIDKERAFDIMKQMNIIHPYGIIGDLKRIPLGKELDYGHLKTLYQNIRTFAEDSEKTKEERTAIKHLIDRANRVIFLGFAYHQMNLDLLFDNNKPIPKIVLSTPRKNNVECYGTGFGISENDRKYIQSLLWRMDSRFEHSDISGASCVQFFSDFWYRLSFLDT